MDAHWGNCLKKPFTPTRQQTEAADPKRSVWVTANAGSGKTHVLVERVIRLLLDGAEPASILCITFTKAAAAEMATRLYDRLGRWTAFDDEVLKIELSKIGIDNPQFEHLIKARQLFTMVLETPGGLKIQTIHAYCERLLQLFPVEAGIAPGFRVLDERQARHLRDEAKEEVLRRTATDQILSNALSLVVENCNSEAFSGLVQNFLSSTNNLRNFLESDIDRESFSFLLKNATGLELDETQQSIANKINEIDEASYQFHSQVIGKYKPYRGHDASTMMKQLAGADERIGLLKKIFFTKDKNLKPREKLIAKEASNDHPETEKFITEEQERLGVLFHRQDILKRIQFTTAVFTLSQAIYVRVEAKKRQLGSYDFDDLIKRASLLLRDARATQWVLYKLDSGLNHILLDEAQDTSPAQWQIINALADEFFAGSGRPQFNERTIFVVGDRKQSIYSFQGADAATFAVARSRFLSLIKRMSKPSAEIELNISYRSTQEILNAVNKVFPANDPARLGFAPEDSSEQDHTTNRSGAVGRVEVWPLIVPKEAEEERDHWLAPIDHEPAQSPKRQLAMQIARTIKNWIGKRKLVSLDRTIVAGDIMILLQKRGSFFSMLIAELRKIGVPVAGADRLKLHESIAVQDLIAIAQWVLLPIDDYALACLLKSPFVPNPLTETELFDLAHNRQSQSLWHRLQIQSNPNSIWLEDLLNRSASAGCYDFFSYILNSYRKAMLERLGPEASDATDAFLDQARNYELEHGLSLTGFLLWFNEGETEIRRELEMTSGEVRLMTVHGAKGLEANIVFLADAASVPKGREANRITMIPDPKTGTPLPLLNLSGLSTSPNLQEWIDGSEYKIAAERKRLLYVAMTRAREELYICGAKGKRNDVPKDCWYALVEPILGVTEHSTDQDPSTVVEPSVKKEMQAIPLWAIHGAINETVLEFESVTRLKSRMEPKQPNSTQVELERGTSIHTLLQNLPTIPREHQIATAKFQAKQLGLDEQMAISLVNLVNAPALSPFYEPHSESEVEISGMLENGQFVIGRVDRLVVNANEVLLLDYKSDRFVPETITADHPYVSQLSLYAGLLSDIYPKHKIRAALLWTQTAKLEWISEGLMAQARERALNPVEAQMS
jgi:ATP-dependent helicase/nuclease subunit A